MSIIQGTARASGDASFYSFPLSGSLRFDGSNYLTNSNFSNSSTAAWTYSSWVKRSDLSTPNVLFGRENTSTEDEALRFNSNNSINFYIYNSGSYSGQIETTTKFRDASAWYHIVAVWATTMKLYVNGVEIGSDSATGSSTINTNVEHRIGRVSTNYFKGYMAEINFLDGYVPTTGNGGIDSSTGYLNVLGEFRNGVWIPKDPSGLSYGTNGFRLSFENGIETINSVANQIRDESSNSNHWTKN